MANLTGEYILSMKTIAKYENYQIKVDVQDDNYFDAKDPHISIWKGDTKVYSHIYIDQIGSLKGSGNEEKRLFKYLLENKEFLKEQYNVNNPKR